MAYNYSGIDNLYNTGLFQFEPAFSVDETDLNAVASGSGVHFNKTVEIDLGITDRSSGAVSSQPDFLANSYVEKVDIDILDITGGVMYSDFLLDYKNSFFTFTEYDNFNVFGDYAKHFGVRIKLEDRNSGVHTSEFYFYGNDPIISGITVQDSTGTTSHSSSLGSKTAVNADGQTGALSTSITFLNDTNYISLDRLEIYYSSTSSFDPYLNPQAAFSRSLNNNSTQSFDIKEGELPNGEAVYLHYVPYGNLGSGLSWSVGPYTFADNPVGADGFLTVDDTGDFITGITSGDITGALGYTPLSSSDASSSENYYLTGVSKSNNTFTFHVDGASDPTYQLTSGDITGALGFSPISTETDDQNLNEVLSQGNTSASGITVGASTISGSLEVANNNTGISDIFHVDGLNGRLFGVTDEVTGTVFSVNDAAGLPIVEVESTSTYDKITMGEYGSDLIVLSGQTSAQLTGSQIASESWVASQGYLTSETDDQDLDEVLTQGNISSQEMTVGKVEAEEFIGNLRGAVSFTANAGEALTKGDVVYISGVSGNKTVVAKADADDSNKMPAFGVANETVNANADVTIINFGAINNLDTDTPNWDEGDELYVSNTAGTLSKTAPSGEGSQIQKMAKVTKRHASTGSITIMGAGRTNAVPNLNEGRLFVGNSSNEAVADDTAYIDIANSRVGIGTTNPNVKLHVEGDPNAAGVLGRFYGSATHGALLQFHRGASYNWLAGIGGGSASAGIPSSYFGIVENNNTPRLVIAHTTGNVGIGTTSPATKLHILTSNVGASTLYADVAIEAVDAQLDLTSSSGGSWGSAINFVEGASASANTDVWSIARQTTGGSGDSSLRFNFGTSNKHSNDSKITFTSSGSVGIGTTSVGTINGVAFSSVGLHVKASTLGRTITEGSSWGEYIMNHSGASANQRGKFIQSKSGNFNLGSYDDNGTQRVQMTVLNGGNVGIGIATPAQKLEVFEGYIRVGDASNVGYGIEFERNSAIVGLINTANGRINIQASNNGDVELRDTAGTGNLILKHGGNVGIGTTSPAARLEVESDSTSTDSNTLRIKHTRSDANVPTEAAFIDMNLSGADNTTADRTNAALKIDLDSSANGDAANEHRIHGVDSDVRFTGFSDVVRGGYFYAESNYTVGKTAQLVGVYGNATHDANSTSGGVSNMYGVFGTSSIQDLGDVDNAFGGYFSVTVSTSRGDANVGVTKGVEGEVRIDKNTTIDYGTMIGVSSVIDNNQGSTPNFGTQYLFKGDYQGTKGSNAYGIHVEGDKNYFEGNVGIGVENPSRKLQITQTSTTEGGAYVYSNAIHTGTGTSSLVSIRQDHASSTGTVLDVRGDGTGDKLIVWDLGSVSLIVKDGGNVGIGTDSPAAKLHVGPNTLLGSYTSTRTTLAVSDTANGAELILRGQSPRIWFDATSGGMGEMYLDTAQFNILSGTPTSAGDSRFYIKADGDVGIGTNTPSYKLDVNGSLNSTSLYVNGISQHASTRYTPPSNNVSFTRTAASNGSDQWFKIYSGGGSTTLIRLSITSGGDNTQSRDEFLISVAGYGFNHHIQRLPAGRYNGSKLLAIATTNPSAGGIVEIWVKLDGMVSGSASTSIFANAGLESSSNILSSATGTAPTITSNGTQLDISATNRNDTTIMASRGATFGGNVGIGTTGPVSKLQVSTTNAANILTLHRDGSNNGTNTTLNRIQFAQDYNSTQQNWGRIDLDSNASPYRTDLKFYVKSTSGLEMLGMTVHGTASDGPRVGIGVTNPSSKLHVQDNSTISSGDHITNKVYSSGGVAANGDSRIGLNVETNRVGWYNADITAGNFKVSNDNRIGNSNIVGVKSLATLGVNNGYSGVSAAGSLTAFYGKITTTFSSGESPVSNAYGVRIDAPEVAASSEIGTYYGIHIDGASTSGTVTNKYALVTEAAAGNVGIGTTGPAARLELKGSTADTTANAFVARDSASASLFSIRNDGRVDATGDVVIGGNLTVSGTTTTIDTAILRVEDHNIELGNVNSPTDITADGGGITLLAGSNEADHKTIKWINSTDAWTFSERVAVPAGSAASPSLTFSNDTDTGLYRFLSGSDDYLAVSTGGAFRGQFGPAGITSGANLYTATSSSFRNYGGTWKGTTGLTGNGFQFINSVDGTALTISSTGDTVASGTVKASSYFLGSSTEISLATTGAGSVFLRPNGQSTSGQMQLASTGNATFAGNITLAGPSNEIIKSNGSIRLNIDSNADQSDRIFIVSTGANSELFRVDESGNGTFTGSVTATSLIKSGGSSSEFLKADGSVDSNTYLTTSSASSTYLPLSGGTIDGSLIIDTDTSSQPFYVTRSGALDQALKLYVDDQNVVFESIQDETADDYGGFIFNMDAGTTHPYFDVRKNNSTIMRVDGSGNVGIGTTTPDAKLHVHKNSAGSVTAISQSTLVVENNSANAISMLTPNSTTSYLVFGDPEDNQRGYLSYSHADDRMTFKVAGSERMYIDSSGRVGIGVVPSSAELEVNGHFAATTKSFIIDNPKTGGKLQYGVVESDEHGVYVRGKSDQEVVELPEEWDWLVHEDSVTVQLTSVGQMQQLFVVEQNNKRIKVSGLAPNGQYNYVVHGTRKDVDALEKHLK